MPRRVLTREEVVDRVAAVFRRYGYEGASLARISQATGLGRSSLYHHFPNGKEDMAWAVLARTDEIIRDLVVAPLKRPGSPRERLAGMIEGLRRFYDGGRIACLTDLFSFGEAGALFRADLAARTERATAGWASLAVDAGVPADVAARRAAEAYEAMHGALIVGRARGDDQPFARFLDRLPALLFGSDYFT